MLIVALVMAVIGLAALVTAVVTSNELIAWVCIGASVIGVVLLIVDALRERRQRDASPAEDDGAVGSEQVEPEVADYPEDAPIEEAPADEASIEDADAPEAEKAKEES